jgi:hypothetical protein
MLFALDPKQVAGYMAALCDKHRIVWARGVTVLAQKNGMEVADILAKLSAAFGLPMTFTCPQCGAVSHNPNDLAHGYCGRCHDFTGVPTAKSS